MITLKDCIVALLVLLGGVSDFNSFDIPYTVYIALGMLYLILRVSGRTKKIKDINEDSLLGTK